MHRESIKITNRLYSIVRVPRRGEGENTYDEWENPNCDPVFHTDDAFFIGSFVHVVVCETDHSEI
jgi:hypothetical protein